MADIVTTRIFQDGEKNITAAKLNDIVASSTIQPAFVSSKPSTSSIATTDNLLVLQTAGTYAKAPFQTVIDSVSAGINADAEIWKVRLRSFNAIGNPTFEVDQRNAGTGWNPGTGTATGWMVDRWYFGKVGATSTFNVQQGYGNSGALLPGTNFRISAGAVTVTLTAQQASLAAGDYMQITQSVEGPNLRELYNDVHSISLLVQCTSAPVTFSVRLSSVSGTAYTITKAFTISTANQWTLVTLPNLPSFVSASSATWSFSSGVQGYTFGIGLGAGSTYTSPANDTWQAGNFVCGPGTTNFASLPVNTRLTICFVQHEPGAVCSTPMDCPFTTNYDACLRYYQKSWNLETAPATTGGSGVCGAVVSASTTWVPVAIAFPKPMAKNPTLTCYNGNTGTTANQIYNNTAAAAVNVSSTLVGQKGISQIQLATAQTSGQWVSFHYTVDTNW